MFICGNERKSDDPRGCCATKGAAEVLDRLKEKIHELKLKKEIRINRAGCLDQCAKGVSLVVYPEGVWYGGVTAADVEEIVESHLLGGKPVERLRTDR